MMLNLDTNFVQPDTYHFFSHASHGELLHSREFNLELNHWKMAIDQANMAGLYHWKKNKSHMLAERTRNEV